MQFIIPSSISVLLIIYSCLCYGSVTIFPITVIELSVIFLFLLWFSRMAFRGKITLIKTGFLFPLVIFLGFVVLQLIPLPLGLIGFLSPKAAFVYKNFMPENIRPVFLSLSICGNSTFNELIKLSTYIMILLLVINNIDSKKKINIIFNCIIFFGLAISFYGIIQKYTFGAGKMARVYWFDPAGSAPAPFGPFANRNNFAGYINMIIPLALGYFLMDIPLSKRITYGFSIGIMSVALFLSLSRAGIIVYTVVLLFFLLFLFFKENLKPKIRMAIVWLVFTAIFLFLSIELRVVINRMATLFKGGPLLIFGHGYPWKDIFRVFVEFPFFGTGLGTFGNVSQMYKTVSSQELFVWAHNDFLQILSETGIIGFSLVALFFALYFKHVILKWLQRHNSFIVCLSLGGLSSIFSVLIYALFDFNLQIPAIAILFFTILGLIYRLVNLNSNKDGAIE